MRAVKNHADESNTRKSNMRLYRYRRGQSNDQNLWMALDPVT